MTRFAFALALAAAVATGCGPSDGDDDGAPDCEASLLPGDLVISEIQANPNGPDEGAEWFEIFNATSAPVSLAGLTLFKAKIEGDTGDVTSDSVHIMVGGEIPAGGYFVVGGVLEEFKPTFVNYGYADSLGSLQNSFSGGDIGVLALRCAAREIDRTTYSNTVEGESLALDGASAPDASANDIEDNFCESVSSYGTNGDLGTPGAANDPCEGEPPLGQCNDGGTPRDPEAPADGDLVITEVMANPGAVSDNDGEWFEVFVARDVDLNGLQIGREPTTVMQTLSSTECLRVTQGSYIVFADEADSGVNGMIPQVDFDLGFSLTNSGSGLFLAHQDVLLDAVTWASVPDGASRALDPGATNTTANDDDANWCAGTAAYGLGDLGTPGAENDACDVTPPDGMCMDGAALRPIVKPNVGELVVTEVFPNPLGAGTDATQEWFEVLALADVDLNGLTIADASAGGVETIDALDCIRVTTGGYALFAKNVDPTMNGGLPAVDVVFGFSLNNSGDETVSISDGATVIDTMLYNGSTDGVATQLDPDLLTATDNDNPANFCPATTSFGTAGGLGTPKATNDVQCN